MPPISDIQSYKHTAWTPDHHQRPSTPPCGRSDFNTHDLRRLPQLQIMSSIMAKSGPPILFFPQNRAVSELSGFGCICDQITQRLYNTPSRKTDCQPSSQRTMPQLPAIATFTGKDVTVETRNTSNQVVSTFYGQTTRERSGANPFLE